MKWDTDTREANYWLRFRPEGMTTDGIAYLCALLLT